MTSLVLAAVTCAALLHASWNAMLRGGRDRLWSMTLMMLAVTGVTAIAAVFVPLPARASWPYVVGSAALHTVYNLSLVRTYRSGDLGQTYPISRGSSPVLVAVGAALFAHEDISLVAAIGIALVSGGILSLALRRGGIRSDFLPAAFTTGVLIGAYTVVDGIGVRLSGNSLAYANAMFLLWGLATPILYFGMRGRPAAYTPAQTAIALTGGLVSLVAYGIVIWAMQYDAMGLVSALRETSVVYAAIIGRLFLRERLSAHRIASCVAIAAGAACLAF
ncbi:MAG: EamA family transporter [Rhodospirillales bacterium]|nr:EamA family transporter [Rhodospirillales bacterium]